MLLLKNPDINQVMIKRTVSVTPNTSLIEAREILLRHKLNRVVVLDPKERPVGIITEKDVARTMYTMGNRTVKSVKVKDFMSKNLITVSRDASAYDVAKLMKKNKISSVIVLNSTGTLAGLVTKTDLASVFLTQATAPLKVSQIMKRKVITAMPSDSLLYVESLLINNRISRVVVARGQKLVGIITYRDFVPAKLPQWISQTADPREVERYKMGPHLTELQINQMSHLLQFKAVDIMTPNPVTVGPDEDVGIAVLLMIRHGISGLPVVKNSKLSGIVTKTDIVNAIASGR